jgi:hypothetical protein
MPIMLRRPLALCVLALALLLAAPTDSSAAGEPRAPIVVKVTDGGFHWGDAAVGAAATLAVGLLVLALVLLRNRTGNGRVIVESALHAASKSQTTRRTK